MSESTWDRAKDLLDAALALPAAERDAFIRARCGGDDSLRAEVESLLQAHEDAAAFFPSAAGGLVDRVTLSALGSGDVVAEGPGDRIGRYKLLQSIGAGGFGEVFMAEQQEPVRRLVALKVIKAGMDTKEVIGRFEAERQALALMDHPNIAKVLDAGATDSGRPYFVMELVKGVPITEFCDANRLSVRERLELFVRVCKAIDHAHERGVIHRDIKPSNVLVTFLDGTPTPIIIDFGIAKATSQRLTERTLFTMFGQFVGTPTYMSPEQAALSNQDVDRRSDVYSLGVLLYELVTGTTPFEGDRLRSGAFVELLRIIREVDPPTPSHRVSTLGARATDIALRRGAEPRTLARFLHGDVDWIVMRAMAKDRRHRYNTAADFAADIERYFRSEPVIARRPSIAYTSMRLVRRHRGMLVAGTMIVVVGVVSLSALMRSRATTRQRDAAQLAFERGLKMQQLAYGAAAAGDSAFNDAFVRADSMFAEVERKDPSFARPIVQRAFLAYRRSRLVGGDTAAVRRLAQSGLAHANRAITLDPTNADAFEVRGTIQYWTWLLKMAKDSADSRELFQRARLDLEKAVALNPKQAGAWAALSHLRYQTDGDQVSGVLEAARNAVEADPFVENAPTLFSRLFLASYDVGQITEAGRYCAALRARFPSVRNTWSCQLYLLTMEQATPDIALAWQLADSVVSRVPVATRAYERQLTSMLVAAVVARASAKAPALADSARRIVRRVEKSAATDPNAEVARAQAGDLADFAAFVYVLLSDDDDAFRELQRFLAEDRPRAKATFADPSWWFQRIAKDARFVALAHAP